MLQNKKRELIKEGKEGQEILENKTFRIEEDKRLDVVQEREAANNEIAPVSKQESEKFEETIQKETTESKSDLQKIEAIIRSIKIEEKKVVEERARELAKNSPKEFLRVVEEGKKLLAEIALQIRIEKGSDSTKLKAKICEGITQWFKILFNGEDEYFWTAEAKNLTNKILKEFKIE